MALHLLAYNLTHVMNIMGILPLWRQSGHNQIRKTIAVAEVTSPLCFRQGVSHDQKPTQTLRLNSVGH
jgi:hypothetical protein